MSRFINPRPQFLNDSGVPLVSGKVFIYESGSNALKSLFHDVNLSIPAANPVILSGSGRMPNTFYSGSARCQLTDSDEVQFWDIDPVGGDSETGGFADWNSITVFNVPDIVVGSDDNLYQSITNGNQGNDPISSPVSWSEVKFIGVYNSNEVYSTKDITVGSDGLLYSSKINSNVGNDPVSDSVNWQPGTVAEVSAEIESAALTFAYQNF